MDLRARREGLYTRTLRSSFRIDQAGNTPNTSGHDLQLALGALVSQTAKVVESLARPLSVDVHAPYRPDNLVFPRLFRRLVSRLLGTPVWTFQPVISGYRDGGIRLTSMVAFELARVDLM